MLLPVTGAGSIIAVTTTLDTADSNPVDTLCADTLNRCSLRSAVQLALILPGTDTIELPEGIYETSLLAANEDLNAGGDFDLRSSIILRGLGTAETVIIQASSSPGTANERVFHVLNGAHATLENMTVRFGNYDTNIGGGGIRLDNANSQLTLNNVILDRNRSAGSGGAIFLSGPGQQLHANLAVFTNNSAGSSVPGSSAHGGAIYSEQDADATILDSTFSGNKVLSSVASTFGGAISLAGVGSDFTITDSQFENNSSISTFAGGTGYAGAIYNSSGILTINHTRVTGNFANLWGGIATSALGNTSLTSIFDSTISNNSALGGGSFAPNAGGLYNGSISAASATTNVTRSTISGNTVTGINGYAGGVENGSTALGLATMNLTNVTISGNSAHDAGGTYNFGVSSTLNFNFCTIAANLAIGNGGGVYQDTTGITYLRNSIVADGTSAVGPNIFGNPISQGYNHLEDTAGGTFLPMKGDLINLDPELRNFGNYGGQLFGHLPRSISQVLNSIPPLTNGCGTDITTDGRGFMRPAGSGCEKGAFEFQVAPSPITGTVVTPLGIALRNVSVRLVNDLTGEVRSAVTSSSGSFTFTDLVPDQPYTLAARSKRYRFSTQPIVIYGPGFTTVMRGLE